MASRTKDQHLDGAKVRDFFMFCARGRGTWPVLPITAGKVYRWFYSIMRRKKLKSSWKSVLPYKKALMRWATQYQKDPFSVLDADVVDDMRKAFKAEFPVLPKQIKIQITDDLFAAVVLSLSPSNPIDRIDRDLYTVLKIAGTRVSSLVLGADKRRFDRIVRLKHVVFLPSSRNRQRVFMLLPVTKTRSAADLVGMMLERNHNPKSKVCAVESLYSQVRRRKRAGAMTKADIFEWLDAYSDTVQLARWKLEGESLNARQAMGKSTVVEHMFELADHLRHHCNSYIKDVAKVVFTPAEDIREGDLVAALGPGREDSQFRVNLG